MLGRRQKEIISVLRKSLSEGVWWLDYDSCSLILEYEIGVSTMAPCCILHMRFVVVREVCKAKDTQECSSPSKLIPDIIGFELVYS